MRFQEHLYFVAIKFVTTREEAPDRLAEILDAHQIRAATVYQGYSMWDLVLRVWLPVPKFENFRLELAESEDVLRFQSMETREIRYRWAAGDENLLKPSDGAKISRSLQGPQFFDQICEVARRGRTVVIHDADSAEVKALAFKRPPLTEDAVKVYLIVSQTDNTREPDQMRVAVREAAGRLPLDYVPSVYVGDGELADVMVKLVVPHFSQTSRATKEIRDVVRTFAADVETYIPDPEGSSETDNVNSTQVYTQQFDQLYKNLGFDEDARAEAAFGLLTEEEQALISRTFDEAMDALNGATHAEQELICKLLRAYLVDEPLDIGSAASFLLAIEVYLAKYMQQAFQAVWDKRWYKPIQKITAEITAARHAKKSDNDGEAETELVTPAGVSPLEAVSGDRGGTAPDVGSAGAETDDEGSEDEETIELPEEVKRWTLGSYVWLASNLPTRKPELGVLLRDELEEGWFGRLSEARDTRNDLAHGRFHADPDVPRFSEAWRDRVVATAAAAALLHKLIRLTGGTTGPGKG